jgi:fatty-acyl-CoA synthase
VTSLRSGHPASRTRCRCPRASSTTRWCGRRRRRPDHPATLFYGGVVTYAELLRQVDALAGYLQNICGVKRGDRVMVALQNSPQYVISYYAVMRADAVVVPINPMNKTAELDYMASDSGATVAIIGSDLVDVFAPLLGNAINSIIVAHYRDYVPETSPYTLPACVTQNGSCPTAPGWRAWDYVIVRNEVPTPMTATSADLCLFPYTSGTTGKPKACMHLHSSVLFTAVLQARWYRLGGDDVLTGVQPFFHVAGMQGSMNAAISVGATLMLMARWDKDLIPPSVRGPWRDLLERGADHDRRRALQPDISRRMFCEAQGHHRRWRGDAGGGGRAAEDPL